MSSDSNRPKILSRGTWTNAQAVAEVLRLETVGGVLLLVGAAAALVWANSPFGDYYRELSHHKVGWGGPLELKMSIAHWAADGLLAVFFFVAGLELKREFIEGELRDPKRAAVPIIAAASGVVVPALIYLAVTWSTPSLRDGWAIPAATDIAFAIAVLAVISSHLPTALRSFLLTLAVVDDLIAIIIIAVAYTEKLDFMFLGSALIPLALFSYVIRQRVLSPWILAPLAFITWYCVYQSGIHATIAGVALGMVVPVGKRFEDDIDVSDRFEHDVRPISAGVAVPIFALFSAGVSLTGGGFTEAMKDPVVWGVMAGLVLGKVIGIFGSTFIYAGILNGKLDDNIKWIDLFGVALLAGIGFTVSLLVNDLAFAGTDHGDHGRIGVLFGSFLAAILASVVLVGRNRHYRKIEEAESVDANKDGIPDVYEDQEREFLAEDTAERAREDGSADDK